MKKVKINFYKIEKYLNDNSDRSIIDIYVSLKTKKKKDLSDEEKLVFSYLKLNKRKYGLI